MANQNPPRPNPTAERNAEDKAARIAAAKLRNPAGPQNQPGSGQLTPNVYAMPAVPRPSQLPQPRQGAMQTAAPATGATNYMGQPIGSAPAQPDVYAPPAAGGATSIANPPPTGNLAPRRVTTVQLASRARNPYDLASGRGTTADAERWQRENGGSISSRIYTPTTSNAPTPGREALLDAAMSPEAQAQKAQQTADNDMMRIEQQYGTPTWQKTGENTYGAVKTMTPHQEPGSARQAAPAANWQQSVTQKHKAIGQAGSPENAAYVAAYKAKKAAGEDFDPSALADEVMQQIEAFYRFSQAPTADPTVAPTASATPPGTGNAAPVPPVVNSSRATRDEMRTDGSTKVVSGTMRTLGENPYGATGSAFIDDADTAASGAPIPAAQRPGIDPYAETDQIKYVDSHDKNGKPIKVPIKKDPLGMESWFRKLIPVPTNDEERRIAAQQRK